MEIKIVHEFPATRWFRVEFTAYEDEIMKEEELTSFALNDAYRSFAPPAQ